MNLVVIAMMVVSYACMFWIAWAIRARSEGEDDS